MRFAFWICFKSFKVTTVDVKSPVLHAGPVQVSVQSVVNTFLSRLSSSRRPTFIKLAAGMLVHAGTRWYTHAPTPPPQLLSFLFFAVIHNPFRGQTFRSFQWQTKSTVPKQLRQYTHRTTDTKQHRVVILLGETVMDQQTTGMTTQHRKKTENKCKWTTMFNATAGQRYDQQCCPGQ